MTEKTTQTTIRTYDNIASRYADRWFDFSLAEVMDRFATYLKPGGLILDLGSGPGRDVVAWQKRGYRVIGLDRSAGMLKVGATRGVKPLILADMRHLPFGDQTFAGVWATASMLHLPKLELPGTLKEVCRVLDNGHLYLSVKEGQVEAWEGNDEIGRRFFAYYHPAEVELALERAGFHVLWLKCTPDEKKRGYNWINAIGWTKLEKVSAGANALIFNDAGQILLTRRADNGLWCLPGGHLDPGEAIEVAAVRETLEETGLTVEVSGVCGMYSVTYPAHMFPEKKSRSVFIIAFHCRIVGGTLTLNDEVTEFGWFDQDSLPQDLMLHQKARVLDGFAANLG